MDGARRALTGPQCLASDIFFPGILSLPWRDDFLPCVNYTNIIFFSN